MVSPITKWKILRSEYLLQHKYMTLRKDRVQLDNGHIIDDYFVIEKANWINVIAITEEGKFVFERQYRHGIGKVIYEIPAGIIEDGEDSIEAAKRELLEETGYSGGEWFEYGQACPNPSSMNNTNYTFLAKGVRKISAQNTEVTENIEVLLLTLEEVRNLLESNFIVEGIQQAPLWRYMAESQKEKNNV